MHVFMLFYIVKNALADPGGLDAPPKLNIIEACVGTDTNVKC